MPGKFIVIEGIDGAGCETQAKKLREKLNARLAKPALFLHYPDYNDPLGESIHRFLHGRLALDVKTQFLLYALNMIKDMFMIKEALKSGRYVVADRYFTSTIVYQGVQGFPKESALKFAELFEIIKPDLVICLKASPEVTIKRKLKEKTDLDRWEKDSDFQKKTAKGYDILVKDNVFAKKWAAVDADKPIEEVSENVWNVIKKELKLK